MLPAVGEAARGVGGLRNKNVLDFVNLPEIRNSEPRLWWNLLKYKIVSPGRNPVGSISGLIQKHIKKLIWDVSNP